MKKNIRHLRISSLPSKKIFYSLIFLAVILALVGLLFIFESSSIRSFNESRDSFFYVKRQMFWLLLSLISMLFFSIFDYKNLYKLAIFFMMFSICTLILVLIPGVGNKISGARRWINLGFFSFQPTEFSKFAVIVYLASWFVKKEKKRLMSFLMFLGIILFLIFLQPDMGTATIVFCLSILIYFFAGEKIGYLLLILPFAFLSFIVMAKFSPYRFNRILAFFDPSRDPLGITYHINQIMISLTNGGFLGVGIGASRQKYLFLPEAHTDSIFAIIGEEVGFLGAMLLVFGFVLLSIYIYRIINACTDRFAKLIASGIFAFFNLQILINLGSMVGLVPLTGVPLPFISYGGSNLFVSFSFIGILINIMKHNKV